jgi:2-(1,2-epoxy-1,2-dihydrophenyl)acetyl-CoA isomerase
MTEAGRPFVSLEQAGSAIRLVLDRPGRGNALVPELLRDLRTEIEVAKTRKPTALVITGRGRAFSAGGDVSVFAASAGDPDRLLRFSSQIVGELNNAILDLLAFPAPVIALVNGPVTGGSAGLVLAADIVLMSESAFLQPWYAEMGFCPDGGWTAMLPERIGCARAMAAQALNTRFSPDDCLSLGLAHALADPDGLEDLLEETLSRIGGKDPGSLAMARSLIWSRERRDAIAEALEREREGFLKLVGRRETEQRMALFLGRNAT